MNPYNSALPFLSLKDQKCVSLLISIPELSVRTPGKAETSSSENPEVSTNFISDFWQLPSNKNTAEISMRDFILKNFAVTVYWIYQPIRKPQRQKLRGEEIFCFFACCASCAPFPNIKSKPSSCFCQSFTTFLVFATSISPCLSKPAATRTAFPPCSVFPTVLVSFSFDQAHITCMENLLEDAK